MHRTAAGLVMTLAAFALAGCRHEPTIFCGVVTNDPERAINPLRPGGLTQCFDDRAACEALATTCDGIGRPQWSCSQLDHQRPNADPLDHVTSCYPTSADCELARPKLPADSDVVVSACTPAHEVSCSSVNHSIVCRRTDADCRRVEDLAASALHHDAAPCLAYTSSD